MPSGTNQSPSYAAALNRLNRLNKFPHKPIVPASKRNSVTFSPSSLVPPAPSQASQSSSPSNINLTNSNSFNDALTDAIVVSRSLADQVTKFDAILRRLEEGYTAMQTRVAEIEKEAEKSKQQHQLLESRVSFLEEENARLFDRVNDLAESRPSVNATPPPIVADETSSCPSKLQAEIEQLKQSARNNEIILSGVHIEQRIKNELDKRRIPLPALCIDIIEKFPDWRTVRDILSIVLNLMVTILNF